VLTTRIDGGVGLGDLQLAPYGARCHDACALRYDGGLVVRITAIPHPGYRLLQWHGACSGSGTSCDVTMTGAPIEVLAEFGPAAIVTVRARGRGEVAQAGGTPCDDSCRWDLVPGASVVLRALAAVGARFAGWRGLCHGAARTCVVSVALTAEAPSVTAVFRPAHRHGRSAANDPDR
jgi:hypothetical protein